MGALLPPTRKPPPISRPSHFGISFQWHTTHARFNLTLSLKSYKAQRTVITVHASLSPYCPISHSVVLGVHEKQHKVNKTTTNIKQELPFWDPSSYKLNPMKGLP